MTGEKFGMQLEVLGRTDMWPLQSCCNVLTWQSLYTNHRINIPYMTGRDCEFIHPPQQKGHDLKMILLSIRGRPRDDHISIHQSKRQIIRDLYHYETDFKQELHNKNEYKWDYTWAESVALESNKKLNSIINQNSKKKYV